MLPWVREGFSLKAFPLYFLFIKAILMQVVVNDERKRRGVVDSGTVWRNENLKTGGDKYAKNCLCILFFKGFK